MPSFLISILSTPGSTMKILLLLISLSYFYLTAQILPVKSGEFILENIKAVTPAGEYSSPRWSPDGTKILFTKTNYKGLYLYELSTGQIIQLNDFEGAGFGAVWDHDSKTIYYSYKKPNYEREVQSVNISTSEITVHQDQSEAKIVNMDKRFNDTLIYVDKQNLNVMAKTSGYSSSWNITTEGHYTNPIVSPDGAKVAVLKKNIMWLFATDGSGLIRSLGEGIANSWSPDGKYILFFKTEDDGHQTLGSDLYITKSDGSKEWQITNTKECFEFWPDWSPNDNRITFSDLKTGTIYIAELKTEN
jgi:Tol biopolymer transport system component